MNNKEIEISVIIPVYNTKHEFLEKCIKSVIAQSCSKNIEVVLVNDGSDERTTLECENYKKTYNNIKLINKINEGVSEARNRGIREAGGKLIMFLDSDDWLEEDACEIILKEFEYNKNDVLIFNGIINYSNKKIYNKFYKESINLFSNEQILDISLQIINKRSASYVPQENVIGTVWGKVYRRDFLINNDYRFNKKLKRAEDHVFLLNILKDKPRIKYIEKFLYNYRQSNESTVNRYTENLQNIFKETLMELIKFIPNDDERFADAYNARVVTYIFNSIKNNYFHKDNTNTLKRKIEGVKVLLNDEINKKAIENVKLNLLNKKQKVQLFLIKNKMIYILYLACRINDLKQSHKKY